MQPDSANANDKFEASEIEKQNDPPKPTERVGFCQPPQATRFKKGVSGNPKGRPRGSLNVATAFTKALREKVVVNENGRRKTVTKLEAALKQLVNKAASGDRHCCKQLIDLARDAEAKNAGSRTQDLGISDIDREVMQGILKRFEASDDHSMEAPDDLQSA